MSRYVVGLTGGIASGKSEVTRRFEALGIVVADADLAARAVVAADSPALARIAERFGADMLLADGNLDRARLRAHVFADPAERTALEAITHPAIRLLMQQQCEQAESPYAIAAIPLLLAYSFINSMTGKLIDSMEMASIKFLNVFRQVVTQQDQRNGDGQ